MGNGLVRRQTNQTMVDRMVDHRPGISSPTVEAAFRAVDRARYYVLEDGEDVSPYDDDPWRRGNLHLSAPCIYASVVEALDLKPGLSFLNLGSGTGYLNTVVGLLVGPNGINHGVEIHADVVEYAQERLEDFKQKSFAVDKYDFVEPIFIQGNCLNLNPNIRYDRIYLGAACLPDMEDFMKKLIKPNGGVLVMPYEQQLMKHVRVGEQTWHSHKLMNVNFTLMVGRNADPLNPDLPVVIPALKVKSLKEFCRLVIRQQIRAKVEEANPDLLNYDNVTNRKNRVKAFEQETVRLRKERKDERFRYQLLMEKLKNPTSSDIASSSSAFSASRSTESVSAQVGSSSGRVLTRAASRLLESVKTSSEGQPRQKVEFDKTAKIRTRSNNQNLPDDSDIVSGSEEEEEGDDDDDDDKSTRQQQELTTNCARARPYIQPIGRITRPSTSRYLAGGGGPLSRRIIPFGVQPDPYTSYSSSDEEESFMRSMHLEEYNRSRSHLLMNWPSSWGSNEIRINAPTTGPSTSELSNLSDNSDYIMNELDGDDNDEDDWESAHSSDSEFTVQDDRMAGNQRLLRRSGRSTNASISSNAYNEATSGQRRSQSHASLQTKSREAAVSRSRTVEELDEGGLTESGSHEQPVSKRLRSRSNANQDSTNLSSLSKAEHLMPGCSRDISTTLGYSEPSSSTHQRRQHTCGHVHHHRHSKCRHRGSRRVNDNCLGALSRTRTCIRTPRFRLSSRNTLPRTGEASHAEVTSADARNDNPVSNHEQDLARDLGCGVASTSSATTSGSSQRTRDSRMDDLPPSGHNSGRNHGAGLERSHRTLSQATRGSGQQSTSRSPVSKRKRDSRDIYLPISKNNPLCPCRFSKNYAKRRFCACHFAPSDTRYQHGYNLAETSNSRSTSNGLDRDQRETDESYVTNSASRPHVSSGPELRGRISIEEPVNSGQRQVAIDSLADNNQRREFQAHRHNPLIAHVASDGFISISSRLDRFESIFREPIHAPNSSRSMNSLIGANLRAPRLHKSDEPLMDHHFRIFRPARRSLGEKRELEKMELGRVGGECRQYHSLIIGHIRELPIPQILREYLNFDRKL